MFIGYRGDDELLDELLRLRAHAPTDGNAPQWVALVPRGGLEKRASYGQRGLQLVELDVLADDPVAYDGVVAEYLTELARAGPVASIDPAALPEQRLTGNPYPGLVPFSEVQSRQFFGREEECRTLVGKLGTSPMGHVRWLMLTGPSGVGKSSLLAAGLVPAVRGGGPPVAGAPTQWCVALLRPGRELLRNLAAAVCEALAHDLGQCVAPEALTREHLLAKDRALTDFLAARLQGRGFLLVLDQFEEAFTVGAAEDRPYFDALLVRGLQDLEIPLYVVTAMRSDCAGDFGRHYPLLAEQLNRSSLSARHDLPPLRAHGLREAVVRPAELAGRIFEAGLVDRILREAGAVQHSETGEADAPDATLPLIAHVLHALVDREPGRVLSLRAYEALGGVAKALTRSADTLLASLCGEYTEAQVRGLLVELVELHPQGRDTRRVLSRAGALSAAGADSSPLACAKAEALLLRLSGCAPGTHQETLPVRLVAMHGEGERAVVDLVHDALLHEWATLRGWLSENREAQLLHRELAGATEAWLRQQRSIDELWRGGRLARASEALTSVSLSKDESIFLRASAEREHAEVTARETEQAEKLRQARRNNRRLQVLGCVLIIASIVALVEYRRADVARAEATNAATLADERLSIANTVVDRILLEALPQLDRVAGTAAVKKQIHTYLEDLQATLLPDAKHDLKALRNRMVQHHERGDLAIPQDNLDLARQEFEAGLQLAEKLVERAPSSTDARRDLSISLNKLADVEKIAGNVAAARLLCERSLAIFEKMAAEAPHSAVVRHDLSISLNKLGDVEANTGNLASARSLFDRSLAIVEKMVADDPDNASLHRDLSVSLNKLGELEKTAGNLAGARILFARALSIREKMVADDPNNASLLRSLGVSLSKLGDVERNAGDIAAARVLFNRTLAIDEKMVAADPNDASFLRSLSIALNKIGDIETAAGDIAKARSIFNRSLSIREKMAANDPGNTSIQRDLSVSLDRLGDIEKTADNLAAARILFERSLAICEKLSTDNPANADLLRDLSFSINNLGDIEMATGNPAAARLLFHRSLSIIDKMATGEPGNADILRELSVSLENLGDVESAAGNLVDARLYFERGLSIREKMVAGDPQNASIRSDLVISHIKLLTLATDRNDPNEVLRHLSAADELLGQLEAKGQIRGFAEREAIRADVNERLSKITK